LSAIGLRELIAESLAAYERRAIELARNPAALAAIRAKLRANRASYPLFDTARFTRHLELAFAQMCERQRRGLGPDSFAVAGAI
jgi:predicted O-linked N-acetylglucosamine transferase (SPINDLY family)